MLPPKAVVAGTAVELLLSPTRKKKRTKPGN
jgi:hypothetical protein